jgi:hypothetical protein
MRSLLAAALALVALAAPARAAAAPRLHGVPAHVRAGSTVRITWAGLGADVHEAEVELSISGSHWVRISPELDAREGGFSWRVPAGLSGSARLRLRYGGEGFEAEGSVSAPFVIETGVLATNPVTPDRELGAWWCLGHDRGALPSQQVSGAAIFQRSRPVLAVTPEAQRLARIVAAPTSRVASSELSDSRGESLAPRASVSRSYPLRI